MSDTNTNTNLNPIVVSMTKLVGLVIAVCLAYVESIRSLFERPKRKSIKGHNVVVTGSAHGLGRELALKFAKLDANLVLVDINEANNLKVKAEVEQLNPKSKVLAFSVDICDESRVSELAAIVENQLGAIDVLVNNAGIVQCKPFLELEPKLVERTFKINTMAHIWMIRNFLPNMIKNKRGHIVAISSIAGLIGNKFLTDYCASKFAVVGLMQSLEVELQASESSSHVRLTTVCPSSMSTGMFHSFTSRFAWLLPVLDASQVAESIVNAVLTNKSLLVLPQTSFLLYKLSWFLPLKVRWLVQEYLDYGVKPHKS